MPRALLLLLPVVLLAGCGSVADVNEFPPVAGPARAAPLTARPDGRSVRMADARALVTAGQVAILGSGRLRAVLLPRERLLELQDARTRKRLGRAPAGVGPTHVVTDGHGLIYVVDTVGDALLVFHVTPRLELTRRVYLPGAPYGVAYDPVRLRLWVTSTRDNVLRELRARGRPAVRRTFAAVRQPDAVAVDPRTGRVSVIGRADGVVQLLDPGYGPRPRSR